MAEEEGTGEAEGTEEKPEDKEEEKKGTATIEEALAKARVVLADKGPRMAMVEDSADREDVDGEEEGGGGPGAPRGGAAKEVRGLRGPRKRGGR